MIATRQHWQIIDGRPVFRAAVALEDRVVAGADDVHTLVGDEDRTVRALDEGAELVLHGHAHEASMSSLAGPQGPIPVLGVPPASGSGAHGEAARWHEIEIAGDSNGWRVRLSARALGVDGQMAELGSYRLAGAG